MRKILLIAACLWSVCPAIAAEKSNFTLNPSSGPHAVGFRVVQQYDYSRAYKRGVDAEGKPETRERARPIQTLIWYPAEPDKNARGMLYGGYLDLLATEEDLTLDDAQRAKKVKSVLEKFGLLDNYERERVQVTKAFRDARPKPGRFPVVVYAPSFSAPAFENADLCEYLASHGYIVVSSPDMGAHSRGMTPDLEGIETQVGDIEFLIGYLQKVPEADSSRIAVVGYSWGGISNVFARIKDDRISAVVSLDGTIRYAPDRIKEAKFVSPNKFTAPFLFLASLNDSLEQLNRFKVDTTYNFLNELKYSDFYLVNFAGMEHQDFSSFFIRFRKDADFKEYTAAEICESHGWMARYVLEFLNAYLRNDTAALQFLKNEPAKNSVPRHLLAIDSRDALHPAPNVGDFARELAKQGFDKAAQIYEQAKKQDAAFTLDQAEVNNWGYELLGSGKVQEAIAVFKLNVTIYPDRWNVYDSLAEAQATAGDKESAIANYKKSLQLNGGNANARERLKKLEAGATNTGK
jgi:dienelactone hydrolase